MAKVIGVTLSPKSMQNLVKELEKAEGILTGKAPEVVSEIVSERGQRILYDEITRLPEDLEGNRQGLGTRRERLSNGAYRLVFRGDRTSPDQEYPNSFYVEYGAGQPSGYDLSDPDDKGHYPTSVMGRQAGYKNSKNTRDFWFYYDPDRNFKKRMSRGWPAYAPMAKTKVRLRNELIIEEPEIKMKMMRRLFG